MLIIIRFERIFLQRKQKVNKDMWFGLTFLVSESSAILTLTALINVDWHMSRGLPREAPFYSAPSCLSENVTESYTIKGPLFKRCRRVGSVRHSPVPRNVKPYRDSS